MIKQTLKPSDKLTSQLAVMQQQLTAAKA